MTQHERKNFLKGSLFKLYTLKTLSFGYCNINYTFTIISPIMSFFNNRYFLRALMWFALFSQF